MFAWKSRHQGSITRGARAVTCFAWNMHSFQVVLSAGMTGNALLCGFLCKSATCSEAVEHCHHALCVFSFLGYFARVYGFFNGGSYSYLMILQALRVFVFWLFLHGCTASSMEALTRILSSCKHCVFSFFGYFCTGVRLLQWKLLLVHVFPFRRK